MLALLTIVAVVAASTSGGSSTAVQVGYSMDGSEETRAEFERYLNALAQNNAAWFKRHPDAECCAACAGIRYVPPETCGPSCQKLQNAEQLLRDGAGTCGPIAAYNAGHMLAEGKDAFVRVVHMADDTPYQYHALVGERGVGGRVEYTDPAREIQEGAA